MRYLLGALVALGALVGGAIPAESAAPAPAPPYRLSKIAVSLFYNESGTFSPDLPKNFGLWNTIIGEGSAKESSHDTLIRITVRGAPGSYESNRAVKVSVRQARGWGTERPYVWGTTTLRRTQPLGVLSPSGTWVNAFWLYDTGCTPLQVTATLVGQAPSPSLVRVIPFACGE